MPLRESCRCMSIEAKDLYLANNRVLGDDHGYEIRKSDGSLNIKRFTNTFDWSLDAMKLCEVYEKRMRRKDFAVRYGKYLYTTNVICVTFKYSYKEFNMAGKNVYVRNGYMYRDCPITDGTCVMNGQLIAIQTNVEIKNPLPQEILGQNFTFEDGYYKQIGTIPTIIDKGGLREYLYENGFKCDGIEYVRYKRSSGSSRVGKCLFVNKILYDDMLKWDKCGLDIKPGQQIDLAAWEAYISLPMSSIIDTIDIPLESILVIDDYESDFEDDVISVDIADNHLAAHKERKKISNSIWDGQSLMDSSMFQKYSSKGMLLLRNRFFKSCCFNTNIQRWFADNGITNVSQLNGYTKAKDVSQIKLITTPSSIKYAKFGKVSDWLNTVDPIFGIVKYEKKPFYFDGRMVQVHYQLLNSLQMSYQEVEEFLKPSLDFISGIRSDPAVMRYRLSFPDEEQGEWGSLKSKNEIVYKLLGVNDRFADTKMYHDFRNDLVTSEIRNLKRGHVLVNGNYSTLMGNGLEMLKASIGRFCGESELGIGNVHSKRFEYGKTILCSRSPHVNSGNVLLVNNVCSEDLDKYFNLTTEIVCVNAIGENIQQRLNG